MNISNKYNTQKVLAVLAVFIFVYVVLFEFILPLNKILPKPSLFLESFIALWSDYSLLEHFLVSFSAVYLSIIGGYLIISAAAGFIIKLNFDFPGFFDGLRIFRYFPAFFFALLFAFWFNGSITGEFIFLLIGSSVYLGITLNNQLKLTKLEFLFFALSLGVHKNKIYSDILRKSHEPAIVKALPKMHIYLWILVMIFEFVGAKWGFGSIYRLILYYNDFSALFALAIVISLIIWIGNSAITSMSKKIVRWET